MKVFQTTCFKNSVFSRKMKVFHAPCFKNRGFPEGSEGFSSSRLQFSAGKWRFSKLQASKHWFSLGKWRFFLQHPTIILLSSQHLIFSAALQKHRVSFGKRRLSKLQASKTSVFLWKMKVFQAPGFKRIGFPEENESFPSYGLQKHWFSLGKSMFSKLHASKTEFFSRKM